MRFSSEAWSIADHRGLDDIRIVAQTSCRRYAWPDHGSGVVHAALIQAQTASIVHAGIHFEIDELMPRERAHVGNTHREVVRESLFDDEVGVVRD
jgi:hypothetical protein